MKQTAITYFASRRGGKTAAMEKRLSTFVRRNPRVVIVTVRPNGEIRLEKPVEVVPQKLLPDRS